MTEILSIYSLVSISGSFGRFHFVMVVSSTHRLFGGTFSFWQEGCLHVNVNHIHLSSTNTLSCRPYLCEGY